MFLLTFILLTAATAQGTCDNPSWEPNTVYEYVIEGRTLTALHQLSNQYSGLLMRAAVELQAKTSDVVSMQVKSAEYSDVHTTLVQGWSSSIPESLLQYQPMQLSKTPIELNYRKGLIRGITVRKDMPTWELNLVKSIANLMQVDTRAENLIESHINSLPSKDSINAVYKTMEESLGGLCETMYDISPLPPVSLINRPELAPLPGGQLIDIVKSRNFSHCRVPAEYHFGITGLTDWMPSSNQMGEFLARTSMSRIIVTGNLDQYTIQSSVTTSKVIASPFLGSGQNGMVVSNINLTLANIKSANDTPQSPISPIFISNLIYKYNPGLPYEKNQFPKKDKLPKMFKKYDYHRESINLGDDSNSDLKMNQAGRMKRSASNENVESSPGGDKKIESDKAQKQDNNTLKLSPRDWLMQFRPDIIEKILTFRNEQRTALVHDPLSPTSSESSSEHIPKNRDTNHLSQMQWLEKFRPDIYFKVIHFQNLSMSSPLSKSSFPFFSDESSNSSDRAQSSSRFSWGSSEKSTYHPKINEAPQIPFIPMFIGNKGNSIHSAKEIEVMTIVRKIAQEIGCDIQHPSSIPGQMTLSKFTVLTEIIQTMSEKQMSAAMNELYFPDYKITSSSSVAEYYAWTVFRDAVAQAGTGPALLVIKEMIESKKVEGEEAAQLVSVLPESAHYPNIEYINTFFTLTTSKLVTEQDLLNTSAIISFTELAREAFVNKSSAYKRFPSNVYGPLMPKGEQPVVQKYIPYFARGLKQAVRNADSNKIRLMITALGNMAHPRVLRVFEPYLEGREPLTGFQRLTMVVALNRMAKIFPDVARPVLFRIYQNTAEISEIRVAAVFQIMKTNPPAQTLQRMAQFTNEDLDLQVISAVQSAIRSAATLSSPSDHELKMNAQAAVDLLNPVELPVHMSTRKVHSSWANQLNLAYKLAISYIGSGDGLLPSNVFYSLRRDLGGFKRQTIGFSAMSSSLDAMVDLTTNQFIRLISDQKKEQTLAGRPMAKNISPWTEGINKLLDIVTSPEDQVEASLYMTTLLGKRYFTLDNYTIEHLPQTMMKAASVLRSGRSFNYTKMMDKLTVSVGFPLAMGLPFVFTLKTPTLMKLTGSVQAQVEPNLFYGPPTTPSAINVTADLHLVYSSRAQSQMGFTSPFNQHHYVAGVSKNIQVNIPFKSKIDVDLINRKLFTSMMPLDGKNVQNLMEYSTVPYTANRNILDLVRNPQKEMQPDDIRKRNIHVRSINQIHKTFGQDSTGFAFDFDYRSEQRFIDFAALYNDARKHDPLSAMIFAGAEDSINFNNITLAFNPQKSTAKQAKFAMAYLDDSDTDNEEGLNSNNSEPASASMAQASTSAFDSRERQQQFLSNVSAGIQDSSTMVVDLSAEFQGQSMASFVATFAAATSFTSPKARYLFFANKDSVNFHSTNGQNQVCIAAETWMPIVPLMNFSKALDDDPTSSMSAEIISGVKCSQPSSKISIKGKMRRSEKRHELMRRKPLAQLCQEQMRDGNHVLAACRNVTMHATCLDQYKFTLQFDKVSEFWKDLAYKAYSAVRFINYQYISEDLISHNNPKDALEVDADFTPDLSGLNVSVKAPMLSAHFTNLRIDRMVQPLLVVHPEYSAVQRAAEYVFHGQQFPTCVVDKNQAETFDNKSYPVNLGQCWHLMMHYTPKVRNYVSAFDIERNVSILIRDYPPNIKEVMLIVGGSVILLEPSGVTIDQQPITVQQDSLTQARDSDGQVLAQMYRLPSGAIRLFTTLQNIELLYDTIALKIRAPNCYRSRVRGLCGTFNSQPLDDFTSPVGCVMRDPFEFAASYALDDETCQGPSKVLRPRTKQTPCLRNNTGYTNLADMSQFDVDSQEKLRLNKNTSCTEKPMMIVKRDQDVCFSLKAQIQCAEDCKPTSNIVKKIDFFCIESTSTAVEHWINTIIQRKVVDFSQKKATVSFNLLIPESCLPFI